MNTTTQAPSKERVEFERWLFESQGLESAWEPHRNCHKDFAAHLAFKAWQAARSSHEPEAIPRAWFRVHHTPDSVNGPAEADIDMAWGDQPEGDGWKPLYLRPSQPPAPAPFHLTEHQVEHLLDILDGSPSPISFREYAEDRKCSDSDETMPRGLYMWFTEYPEEGQMLLKAYSPDVEAMAAEMFAPSAPTKSGEQS